MTYSPSRGRPLLRKGESSQQCGQILACKRPLERARGGFITVLEPEQRGFEGGEIGADEAVQPNPRMPWLLGESGEVTEGASHLTPELQAADVAAGYARRLYESDDGLKKVCIEFRQVLLNGTLIRDWQQQLPIG